MVSYRKHCEFHADRKDDLWEIGRFLGVVQINMWSKKKYKPEELVKLKRDEKKRKMTAAQEKKYVHGQREYIENNLDSLEAFGKQLALAANNGKGQ
ncbi:hypothetical protein V6R21_20135 [Limibacter armeniacum]|uniref:hypothetical protein n=1 Tax=Limibacter armeniacum TaxID=466084 RepID=UPI002FE51246